MQRIHSWIMSATVLTVLGACGGDNAATVGPPDVGQVGLLAQVSDPAALERSIKAGFTTIQSVEGDPVAAGAPADSFTDTYTQETNVDEFDAVRYDGTQLYVAPRRYFGCCYRLDAAPGDGALGTGTDPGSSIRILATDPGSASASLAGSIPLEDGISVQGMYVADERLVALTAEAFYGAWGGFWTDVAMWAPNRLGYLVYDVSDPAAATLEADVSIDGVFVESRRIGNLVYIVSRYTPSVDGLHYYVTTEAERLQNEALLNSVTLDELLPTITVNGATQSLVDPTNCFIPSAAADVGYPVITSVTAVPIDDPTSFTTTCYNDDAYGAYVSENAIYFTEARANVASESTTTRIHKFALAGSQLDYRGSADIEGQVWRGGQADFRMSESNGDLRLLASAYDWVSPDFVDHKLYILREAAGRPALEIVSQLPNANRPEEIGKPNEDLYGVRFLGDRAYAVTFERIDPLYAIDLSDTADPQIAGELAVTGFSDFLHPVTDELLLGLGTADNGGIKLELFDVSDISSPLSRGGITLGESGSFSEATYNRHAFTYQADVGGIDRLAIPANVYPAQGAQPGYNAALHLFEIHDKATPDMATLQPVGSIAPPLDQIEIPYIERNRAFIHNDAVFYIQNEMVWGAFWSTPTSINGPF